MNPRRSAWCVAATASILASGMLVVACMGGDDAPAARAPSTTANAGRTAAAPSTPGPSRGDATTSASPPPAETVEEPTSPADDVVAAAERALNARAIPSLTRDACLENNPERRICIQLLSGPESLRGGLAEFRAGDPEGGAFRFFMAARLDGSWGYWFGTQQDTYTLTAVPGSARACGEARVHSGPRAAANVAGRLPDGTTARVTAVVLTRDGTFAGGGPRGEAWYRLASPVPGWVPTSSLAASDCQLRDAIEGGTRG